MWRFGADPTDLASSSVAGASCLRFVIDPAVRQGCRDLLDPNLCDLREAEIEPAEVAQAKQVRQAGICHRRHLESEPLEFGETTQVPQSGIRHICAIQR